MAILRMGEVIAGSGEGGATAMQAVCIVYLFAAGLGAMVSVDDDVCKVDGGVPSRYPS